MTAALPPESIEPVLPQKAARAVPSTAVAAAVLAAFALGVPILLGHEGRRVAQLIVLAAPLALWLMWPLVGRGTHRLRAALVGGLGASFVLDGVVRAYLFDTYQAAPDSSLVLAAVANTNGREQGEYLAMHGAAMAGWAALALALIGLLGWAARRGARCARVSNTEGSAHADGSRPRRRMALWLLSAALLVSSLAYAVKPWRRLHPVLFWPHWTQSMLTLREGWADRAHEREALLARAHAAAPALVRPGPATVVLVITDSINRDNLGLYGYARATTPALQAQQAALRDELLVLRHAWSVDASTLPALRNMLFFGAPQDAQRQHLLAIARAAGYKVWWMSNHDDVAIEQEHALLADTVDFVNRTPGRAGQSLDGELLDCLQEAIEDPSERKLIVVHLMGAHPHYGLRFPKGANPFDDHIDPVEQGLENSGRSARVRRFRQQYDAALLYHDAIVAQSLKLTRTAGRADARRAWMYVSDHGQDVGHHGNHAGHSPMTEAGYRIPALLWRADPPWQQPAAIGARPFRADWIGWTLADLLQVQWPGLAHERNVLDPAYRWQAPRLPMPVDSFEDR